MVVGLRGKVDGKEIIFERSAEDEWKAAIPRNCVGFYVVELEAFDEAGNRAYTTKFLLTFDPSALYIKLAPCNYQAGLIADEFWAEASLSRYFAVLQARG